MRSNDTLYHMMGRGFDETVRFQQSAGYNMAPFFPPGNQYAWPRVPYSQGLGGSIPLGLPHHRSPFARLGPPDEGHQSHVAQGSEPSSSSSRPKSVVSAYTEEEDEGEEEEEGEDTISLHPDWDIELEPGRGSIEESLKTFVRQCVKSPLTNQQRKKALDKHPLPEVAELRPPKVDMTMKLLVGKPTSSHDGWLQKMLALCMDANAPLLVLLNE